MKSNQIMNEKIIAEVLKFPPCINSVLAKNWMVHTHGSPPNLNCNFLSIHHYLHKDEIDKEYIQTFSYVYSFVTISVFFILKNLLLDHKAYFNLGWEDFFKKYIFEIIIFQGYNFLVEIFTKLILQEMWRCKEDWELESEFAESLSQSFLFSDNL